MESDDDELLRSFFQDGSQEAFSALARRYAGLLYHAALRQTRHPGLAEEAAQNALAILARKAGSLKPGISLAPWLHRTVCFEAKKLRRGERRHDERMKHFHDSPLTEASPAFPQPWEGLEPHLDQALDDLSEADRQVVMLKHFEGWTFEEMAHRLGGQAAAWRQRGSRALDRLRKRLARRGFVVPLTVLTAGLQACLSKSAPAAVAASLGTTPLLAAASLPWKTLAWHTLYTMNAKQITLTSVVLLTTLIPLAFQAAAVHRSQERLAALEDTAASLPSTAGPESSDSQSTHPAMPGKAGLPATKTDGPAAGSVDLRELAKLMAEGRNADPLKIVKFRLILNSLDAAGLAGLIRSAETLDLPPDHRRALYDRLLPLLADKDPALATTTGMRLVASLSGNEATQLWMNPLPNALREWAQKDPSAARAWYEARKAEDGFQNKSLGDADLVSWMASGLFTGMMWGGDRQGGQAFFETLDDAGRAMALRRFGTSNRNGDDHAWIRSQASALTKPEDRFNALVGVTQTLGKSAQLEQAASFIDQAALPSVEARRLLLAAATATLEDASQAEVSARFAWLRAATPADQQPKALGYFLGDAAFKNHEGIRQAVDAEIAAGAPDAFLGAFIRNAAHRTSTMEIAAGYLPQLTDSAERTRTLREMQQGHREAARAAALQAGIPVAELDAALQSR